MRLFNRWSEARDKASGCSTLDARRRRRSASLKRINVRIVEKLFRTVEARLEGGRRLDRFSMTVSSPTGLSFPRGRRGVPGGGGGPRTISTSVSSRVSML